MSDSDNDLFGDTKKPNESEEEEFLEGKVITYEDVDELILIFVLDDDIVESESEDDIDEELKLPADLTNISQSEKRELYKFKKSHTEVN
jgi:hypothetical protein